MQPERIVDGVYRILKGYVNAYLVEADDGLTIVDTGMPRKRKDRLLDAVRASGHGPGDVTSILITHHHVDHMGNLARLARTTGAAVYAPAIDAPIIRGHAAGPPPNRAVITGKLLGPILVRLEPKREPTIVDVEVTDGQHLDVAGGIRAIHTPGHTAGHTSYLMPREGGILLVGDAAGARGTKVAPPIEAIFGTFTEDLDEARRSFQKLAALDFDVLLPGHGSVVRSGAAALLRAAAPRFVVP
jgi:glyoxylase-like metal-dependent hydrolase (beta-lactamase superfamily II)